MKRDMTGVLENKDDWLWGVSNDKGFQTVACLFQQFEGHNVRITVEDIRTEKTRFTDGLVEAQLVMAAPI